MPNLDPLILIITLLPVAMLGGLLIYRFRVAQRVAQLTRQNKEALDQSAQRWQESTGRTDKIIALNQKANDQAGERWEEAAARTEKMIALLTEIRDQLARIAPASPAQNP